MKMKNDSLPERYLVLLIFKCPNQNPISRPS